LLNGRRRSEHGAAGHQLGDRDSLERQQRLALEAHRAVRQRLDDRIRSEFTHLSASRDVVFDGIQVTSSAVLREQCFAIRRLRRSAGDPR
jgi:hypothetical protein